MVERVAKAVRGVGLAARTRVSPAFWFADRAGGYRLTLLVLFGAVGLVWTVPHIRAPLADMPTDPVEGIVLGLNVVLACLIYGGAWLCALPIGEVTAASPVIAAGTNGFFARGHRWAQPGGVAIDRLAAYCGNDSWVASGLLVAAIAPTLLWPETPILSHLSFLLSWIVIWGLGSRLLRKRWSERLGEDAGSAAIEAGIKLIGRTFTLILVTHALVEIVWGIHADLITVFGIYSRWAFAQALFASVMLVRAVDVLALLGLLGRGSLRFVFFLACSCVYISWGESGIPIGSRATDASAAGSAGIGVRLGLTGHAFARPEEPRSSWLADFVARLDEIPRDQPAVLVAASGGGSRAATRQVWCSRSWRARRPFNRGSSAARSPRTSCSSAVSPVAALQPHTS